MQACLHVRLCTSLQRPCVGVWLCMDPNAVLEYMLYTLIPNAVYILMLTLSRKHWICHYKISLCIKSNPDISVSLFKVEKFCEVLGSCQEKELRQLLHTTSNTHSCITQRILKWIEDELPCALEHLVLRLIHVLILSFFLF